MSGAKIETCPMGYHRIENIHNGKVASGTVKAGGQDKKAPGTYIKWDAPGVENIPDDEEEKIKQVSAQFSRFQMMNFNEHMHCLRGTHLKTQGCVIGKFTVHDNLPEHLAQGMFSKPGTYDVIMRYSSLTPKILPDNLPAPRGIGMKIFGIEGEKLWKEGPDKNTQDWTFNNYPVLELRDPQTTFDIADALERNWNDLPAFANEQSKRVDADVATLGGQLPRQHLVAMPEYSQSAYRHGPYVAKYGVFPLSDFQKSLSDTQIKDTDPINVLSQTLRTHHLHNTISYTFCAQLLQDLTEQPVDDIGIEWDMKKYPFEAVATVVFPPQDSWRPAFRTWWDDRITEYPYGKPYLTPSNDIQHDENKLWVQIQYEAYVDGIDLTVLPFAKDAIASIASLASNVVDLQDFDFSTSTRVDTHTHPIPDWFRALELNAAGRATPSWNISSHLRFMSDHHIAHSILCVSTPQANAFLTETDEALRKKKTLALARLLNSFVAELCRIYPERFSWMAIMPLPHVQESITELKRVFGMVGRLPVGVGVLTNHEGLYPGDPVFDPLWTFLEERARKAGGDGKEVVFVHPTEPIIKLDDGRLINSNPSPLRSGLGEFYFETARAISSLTASSTIITHPTLHFRISHGAGAFPDISTRFLLGFPDITAAASEAYKSRFWYDSAGPVWPNQIKGLTDSMGVPIRQMVFGTDYPYGIGFWDVDANIDGLAWSGELGFEEKEMVFWENARELWRGRIGVLEGMGK
ncbi:hypothetical protein ACET3X_005555 [Alternaria dauci]|uniref:Amidohydrolase-related domain-containing protein n=1 Tax=Alternaria dauci TaxID=48095 RepID=A0ABR3ULX4_9PLEO